MSSKNTTKDFLLNTFNTKTLGTIVLSVFLSSYFLTSVAYTLELTKESFVETLDLTDVKNLDELILKLDESAYKNATFSYSSGALLSAQTDDLRPVLWNENQNFLVTFNSHGNESVEALNWIEESSTWELLELDIKSKKWKVNQDKCLECHGPNSKPIWREYPKWPGFIGSNNDKLKGRESSYYNDFLEQSYPRLKGVKDFIKVQSDSLFPYRSLKTHLDTPQASQIHRRPNMRLGQWLARRNAKAVFHKLQSKLTDQELHKVFEHIGDCNIDRNYFEIAKVFKSAQISRFDLDLGETAGENLSRDWEHIYFDGDAEVFEYLLWFYYKDYKPERLLKNEDGLLKKYDLKFAGNQAQERLLRQMDDLAKWVPLPFSDSLQNLKRKRHLVRSCDL